MATTTIASVGTTYQTVTSAYSISVIDDVIIASGSATYAVTLPTAVGVFGKTYTIKSAMNAGVNLTINTTNSQLIDTVTSRTLLSGDILQIVSDGTKWISLVSPANFFSFRNKIINGDMRIAQRGNSISSSGSSYVYALDRWRFYGQATTGVALVTQQPFGAGQTDVPDEPEFYLFWVQSSAPVGIVALTQPIEDVRTFAGQQATLSFWAKANAARNITTRLSQNFGTGGSASVSVNSASLALSTVWQKYVVTFSVPSISGKTIGANNYLDLLFLDSNASTFNISIAQVQLEAGLVATPFERRPYSIELDMCERYYETNKETNTLGGFVPSFPVPTYGGAGVPNGEVVAHVQFRIKKRRIPDFAVYSTVTGAANIVRTPGVENAVSYSYSGNNTVNLNGASVFNATGVAFPNVTRMHFLYDANAEFN